MAIGAEWIALVGTVCGGVGLKVAEQWLGRNRVRVDDAAQIRDELRLEITANREEIKMLETAVNTWRDKYYELYEKYVALQTDLTLAVQKIKDIADAAEKKTHDPPPVPPTP